MTYQWIKPSSSFYWFQSQPLSHLTPGAPSVPTAECYLKLDIKRLQNYSFCESSLNCLIFFFPELRRTKAKQNNKNPQTHDVQKQQLWKQPEFLCLSSVVVLVFCNISPKMMARNCTCNQQWYYINKLWRIWQVWGRQFGTMLTTCVKAHKHPRKHP